MAANAKQLKEQGNKLYAQGKLEAALDLYSQAIVSLLLIFKVSALPWLASPAAGHQTQLAC